MTIFLETFEDFWRFELSISSRDMNDVRNEIESGAVRVPVIAEDYSPPDQFQAVSDCADASACVFNRIVSRAYAINNIEYVADVPGKSLTPDSIPASTESLWQLIEGEIGRAHV